MSEATTWMGSTGVRPEASNSDSDAATCQLSIIVPTFNESRNIAPLIERLDSALDGIKWEAIFVDDDSTDGTSSVVRAIAQQRTNIRCIQRIGRRGLASACVEGILSTSSPYFAVIDADLQHDESIIPEMLKRIRAESLDVVVASRYTCGGSVGEWQEQRKAISALATRLSRSVIKVDLSDPMSGFFLMDRESFMTIVRQLSVTGFKILLDIFASAPTPLRFGEVPYRLRQRLHGESKLDTLVAWEYIMLLADKLVGHLIPVRFLLFAIIGSLGLVTHVVTLAVLHRGVGTSFAAGQAVATLVAMTSNFLLNNAFTYRDVRLNGRALVLGLLSFYAVSLVGAVANVGIATFVVEHDVTWWISGMAGALIGAVWNYSASSIFTWRRRRA